MKPTKNRVYCNQIGRVKMAFPSQEKAERFISFNRPNFQGTKKPERAYYCISCNSWHITSSKIPALNLEEDIKSQEGKVEEIKSLELTWEKRKSLREARVKELVKKFNSEVLKPLCKDRWKVLEFSELEKCKDKVLDIEGELIRISKSSDISISGVLNQINTYKKFIYARYYLEELGKIKNRTEQVFKLYRFNEVELAKEQLLDSEKLLEAFIGKLGINPYCKCEVHSLKGLIKSTKLDLGFL